MADAVRMAADDDTGIEGWAVPFDGHIAGGKDSYGTRFSAQTEYALDWYQERPLLYGHGLDAALQLTPVGTIRALELRDAGVWMQAQLDAQSEYFDTIREMVKAGKLYLSSGSVEHLVQLDRRTGDMIRWPVVEVSLTTVPANLCATVAMATFRTAVRAALPADLTEGTIIHPGAVRADAPPADDAPAPPTTSYTERSYEDIRGDIQSLLNPGWLYGYETDDSYRYVVATFADHVIVCEMSDGGDGEYYRVAYTLNDRMEPALASVWEPVEQAYVPAPVRTATTPLVIDSTALMRHAHALTLRTQDQGERRYREGRVLSQSNLTALDAVADGLATHVTTLRALTARARGQVAAKAEAARWADPAFVELQIALLDL